MIALDKETKKEILRLYRQESMTIETIAEYFGIPESVVSKVLIGKL